MSSELQKVGLQYGRDCWAISSTAGLIRFLRQTGRLELAEAVSSAVHTARLSAKAKYFRQRKKLQPDWKNWDEQCAAMLASDDLCLEETQK